MTTETVHYKNHQHKSKDEFVLHCQQGQVLKWRKNQDIALDEVYEVEEVFVLNGKFEERPSKQRLAEAFGTDDLNEIHKIMIRDGELKMRVQHDSNNKEGSQYHRSQDGASSRH